MSPVLITMRETAKESEMDSIRKLYNKTTWSDGIRARAVSEADLIADINVPYTTMDDIAAIIYSYLKGLLTTNEVATHFESLAIEVPKWMS